MEFGFNAQNFATTLNRAVGARPNDGRLFLRGWRYLADGIKNIAVNSVCEKKI